MNNFMLEIKLKSLVFMCKAVCPLTTQVIKGDLITFYLVMLLETRINKLSYHSPLTIIQRKHNILVSKTDLKNTINDDNQSVLFKN